MKILVMKNIHLRKSKYTELERKTEYHMKMKVLEFEIPKGNVTFGRILVYHKKNNLEIFGGDISLFPSIKDITDKFSLDEKNVLGDAKYKFKDRLLTVDAQSYSYRPIISEVANQSADLLQKLFNEHDHPCNKKNVTLVGRMDSEHMELWKALGYRS